MTLSAIFTQKLGSKTPFDKGPQKMEEQTEATQGRLDDETLGFYIENITKNKFSAFISSINC